MPSRRTIVIVGSLLVLALLGAGAAGLFDSRPPSDPAAERVAANVSEATASVPAYSFAVGGRVVAERSGDRRTAEYDGRGAFNRSERAYRIHLSLADDAETRFLRGHTLYTPCPHSRYVNVENASYATGLPENRSWTAYTMLGGQRRLFDVSRLYDRGTATVDGTETRVVEVVPDRSALSSLTTGVPDGEDVERMNAEATNLTATMYVSTETDLPLRIVVHRERGGFNRPTVTERIVYDFSYGPTTVETPERTVESEDACPVP